MIESPDDKGMKQFLKEMSDEEWNNFRLRILNVSKEDIVDIANKYFIPQLENGETSRVIFGNVKGIEEELANNQWLLKEPFNFISEKYFQESKEEMLLL
jgi:Zn-dependent M16 (insulinase) family peptidase